MSTLFSYSDIPLTDRHPAAVPIDTSPLHNDSFVLIERQARHLEQRLQKFLDAQSEGLLAGLSGNPNDESFSATSSTPTVSAISSPRASHTVPVRQPPPKKISLRAARRGILKCMDELLNLKEDEKQLISSRIYERRDAIRKVESYATKQKGLEKAISEIRSDRDGQKHSDLKREAHDLEQEIQELEIKLAEKRTRYRHVKNEITQTENSVEARLSSYQASLSLHESEVQRFLERPPLEPLELTADKSSFHALNPKTRTLEMARDHWRNEQHVLRKRQRGVDAEISALEEGGSLWQSVAIEVANFERKLRTEMQRILAKSPGGNPSADPEEDGNLQVPDQAVKKLLASLESVSQHLEEKLEIAEERDWKLLVCCIGAELEAIKEAHLMLLDIFNVSSPEEEVTNSAIYLGKNATAKPEQKDTHETDPQGLVDGPPQDLLKDPSPTDPSPSAAGNTTRSEDEDDGPDPAWLLSDN